MSSTIVDLFAEDRAHEAFLTTLIDRLGTEEQRSIRVRVRSARGGHARVLQEFELYQKAVLRGGVSFDGVLVAAVDANCRTYPTARKELEACLDSHFTGRTALACPDPHVERWFLADPESFAQVVGAEPQRERRKCERDRYKKLLVEAIRKGGNIPTLGGIEFAKDLVMAMDLYRASKNEPSLKSFIDSLRLILRQAPEG